MLYVNIDGQEVLVNKNINSEVNEMSIKEALEGQIVNAESKIKRVEFEIKAKQSEIESFEYSCTDDEYDEMLDDVYGDVEVCGMTCPSSRALKELDPIAYNCGKGDYESNYDLDSCEEYTDLQDELEDLEADLESLREELEDLQDDLDSLESE